MYLLQTPNRSPAINMSKYKETSHLITKLSCDPDVQRVSVNSTLNKRYIRDDDECLADDSEQKETGDGEGSFKPIGDRIKVECNQKKSKALIICNQFKMKPGMTQQDLEITNLRRNTLTKAQTIFKEYWNFEVCTF